MNRITITIDQKAIQHIAEIGFDPQFGARPVKRVIQKELLNELSKMILAGKVDKEKAINVTFDGKELSFEN